MMRQILVGALLAVALIACGGDSDDATTSPMTLPTAVTVAVATSPAVVADTPAPATAAQEDPTATVPPVPESSSATPDDVIAAFVAAGLEAESPRPLTREDYGAAPYVGQGVRFLIPSLGEDMGGRIIVVPDAADRERLATYYRDLGKQSAMFFSHVFEVGDVVVQINGRLADDVAAQYEAALQAIGG